MAKQDLQKTWEERINRAKALHSSWREEFKVQMGRDYFEGKQNPGWPADEWITINKVYSHLMAQLPSLYSIDPYFYVKTKKSYSPDPEVIGEFDRKGKIRQSALNYYKGELKLKDKARMSIQDAHFAYGVIKTRFAADQIDNPNAGEALVNEKGEELKDENTGEVLVQPDTLPTNKRYVVSRIHPDNLIFGEDAGPLDDSWPWLAEKITITREKALKDKRYKSSVVQEVQGGQEQDEKKRNILQRFLDNPSTTEKKEDDILTFWEIYDIENKEWLVIAEGGKKPVVDLKPIPAGIEDHPYSILRFVLRDNSAYPIPPISQGLDPQKEFNLNRSRVLRHRKRFNRKYEVLQQALASDAELSKLESGDDGTMIMVQQLGAVNPIKDAPLDQQTYQELALLNNDMVEVFGSPDTSRGIASADSATEASLLDKRLEVREGDRLSIVVDFVLSVARKLDQLIEANLDKTEAVKITGPQGEFWEKITPEDYEKIEGEFEYTVNVGASAPRLPDIERAQWTAFLSQVIIPMPHILTLPSFMKRMAEMYHIEDEAALKELQELGNKILAGVVPTPGNTGSQPSQDNPAAAIIGAATGALGGNNNGGGAQV